jgi:hypothetical protein
LHGGRRESSKAAGGLAGTKDALKAGQLADFEGKLHVDLIKAKNLVKADLMGKSDPYAVLKFGKQKEKTNTIKNTLEPQWDFSTDFKVPDGNCDTLLVEVFDSDKLGKDKSLGKVDINLLDLQDTEGKWFALQGVKSGICPNFNSETSVHKHRFTILISLPYTKQLLYPDLHIVDLYLDSATTNLQSCLHLIKCGNLCYSLIILEFRSFFICKIFT